MKNMAARKGLKASISVSNIIDLLTLIKAQLRSINLAQARSLCAGNAKSQTDSERGRSRGEIEMEGEKKKERDTLSLIGCVLQISFKTFSFFYCERTLLGRNGIF